MKNEEVGTTAVGLKLSPVPPAALTRGLNSISAPIVSSWLPFSADFGC
jgi:hypothetical protein